MKKGSLSTDIINTTPGLPRCSTYPNHFDTLRKLYRPIGYNNTRYWDDLEAYQRWVDLNLGNAARLREAFEKAGGRTTFDPSLGCLRVNDSVSICFGVAKWRKYESRDVHWTLHRRSRWPAGWIVAVRLGTNCKAIQDYFLLPSAYCAGRWLWISEGNLDTHKIEVFQTFEELARSLVRRVNKATRSTPTKRQRSKAIVGRA